MDVTKRIPLIEKSALVSCTHICQILMRKRMSFMEFQVKSPFHLNLLCYETPVMRSPIVAVGFVNLLMTCIIIPTTLSVILISLFYSFHSFPKANSCYFSFRNSTHPDNIGSHKSVRKRRQIFKLYLWVYNDTYMYFCFVYR